MNIFKGFFNAFAGVLHGFAQAADGTVGAVTSTFAPLPQPPRTIRKPSPPVRVEIREIANQVMDKLEKTYVSRSCIHDTVCIIFIFKPASWMKLWRVIEEIDKSIIETCDKYAKFDTVESEREIELLYSIQQSFGVILPKLNRLLELGTTLSQKIDQNHLSDEEAKETEEFIEIAGTRDTNGIYVGGLMDHIKDSITKWLKKHGAHPHVRSHFQPLFEFWDDHENNLLRFKSWPTVSLVDEDPKPFVIKHQKKVLSPEELVSPEHIYSIISKQAGSELIGKLHFLSIFIIGPKGGTIGLINTVFPNPPTHWWESLLNLGQAYSSSTSRSSSKSHSAHLSSPKSCSTRFPKSPSIATIPSYSTERSRNTRGGSLITKQTSYKNSDRAEKNPYSFIRVTRIDATNQRRMVRVVQRAVWIFNGHHMPELPFHHTPSTTSYQYPTSTSISPLRHPMPLSTTSTPSPRPPTPTPTPSLSTYSLRSSTSSITPQRNLTAIPTIPSQPNKATQPPRRTNKKREKSTTHKVSPTPNISPTPTPEIPAQG